jgi:type VII secretion protein EccB
MATRSDQLHSHQFAMQRLVGALAMRDPDPPASPFRRIGTALLAGVMLAALALAAVGVYGVIRPGGNTSWRDGRSVLVEDGTGARFVYVDGVLHPVLNYASALLILGSPGTPTAHISRESLRGVPRGETWGIPGAPDLLPRKEDLVTGGWTVCSRREAESILFIGGGPAMRLLPEDGALLVRAAGETFLIWHHRRFAIRDPGIVITAFSWASQSPSPVPAALVNAVPAGPDLTRVRLPDAGGPSAVPDARVGQVFVVETQGGNRQYAVATRDGLAEVTQVQADLLFADPDFAWLGGRPRPLNPAEYARWRPRPLPGPAGAPATTPSLVPLAPGGGVCASVDAGGAAVGTTAAAPGAPGEVRVTPGDRLAVDWIAVAPGHGAVVEQLAGPAAPSGPLALITDAGRRFPVPSVQVLSVLGYDGVRPQRLPSGLTGLVPAGEALDPQRARTP